MRKHQAAHPPDSGSDSDPFGPTQWSLVAQACGTWSPQTAAALEELCRRYWPPIYHYVRRHGYSIEDAQDLTQAFFEQLLAKDYLKAANPARGKFRSFLLACLKHFLSDAWDRARAQKRGRYALHVPIELAEAEMIWRSDLAREDDIGRIFDRSWAMTLLETARKALREHYVNVGKTNRHDALIVYLTCDDPGRPYAGMAMQLGLSEQVVKTEVRRMRIRFGELLRREIARTVTKPEEVDEELRYLASIV